MKRMLMVMTACAFLASWEAPVYCQDDSADDRMIEQSESRMDEGLSSEINGDRAQGEAEVDQVQSSMNTGSGGGN
ncbi:MAG: hypothetical protein WC522_05065 [Candidatus Omnitrophota bacterium]